MKITPREKRRHAAGREKNDLFSLSPPRVAFSRVGDFHARPRFAHSTIPEEKWGTTRNLRKPALERKKEGASGESAFTIFILSYEKH